MSGGMCKGIVEAVVESDESELLSWVLNIAHRERLALEAAFLELRSAFGNVYILRTSSCCVSEPRYPWTADWISKRFWITSLSRSGKVSAGLHSISSKINIPSTSSSGIGAMLILLSAKGQSADSIQRDKLPRPKLPSK